MYYLFDNYQEYGYRILSGHCFDNSNALNDIQELTKKCLNTQKA